MDRKECLRFRLQVVTRFGFMWAAMPWALLLGSGPLGFGAEAFLPRRSDPWVADGQLEEWTSTPAIALRQRSRLVPNYEPLRMNARPIPPPRNDWQGVSDSSASLRLAWTDEGLLLAAAIRDDELVNDFTGTRLPHGDSVELFLDARPGVERRRDRIGPGWNQLVVRPPLKDRPAELAVLAGGIPPDEIQWAAVRRDDGWALEMKIPWSVMGQRHADKSPVAGRRIGLQFVVNDRDVRDPISSRPRSMTLNGECPQWDVPQSWFVVFELADEFPEGPDALLGPYLALDAPLIVRGQETLALAVEADEPLRGRIAVIEWTMLDRDGQTIDSGRLDAGKAEDVPLALLTWSSGGHDGHVDWRVVAFDHERRVLGKAVRTLHLAGRSLEVLHARATEAFESARREDAPFRAAAVLGAASDLEHYKRVVEMRSTHEMRLAERRCRVRLDVLQHGTLELPHEDLTSLLALTAHPEAEVTVEYGQLRSGALFLQDTGVVVFRWGSIPMVSVMVENGRTGRTYPFILRGEQLIGSPHPCRELAERAIALVDRREPVTPEQSDELRRMLVQWSREQGLHDPDAVSAARSDVDRTLYCGDVHMHTIYSDGRPTPVGLALNAVYTGMDFIVITDHGTSLGAQVGAELLRQHGFDYPLTVGIEYGSHEGFPLHMGIYPVPEGNFPRRLPLEEAVLEAHRRGAVTTWNHPGKPDDPWQAQHMPTGLQGLPFDAWEHLPPTELYEKWLLEGTMPVTISSSDTHDGVFGASGRAIILAHSPGGDDLADAVRSGRVGLVAIRAQGHLQEKAYYGSPAVVARVWTELDEGRALRERKAGHWRSAFQNADLAGLLKSSPPHTISLQAARAMDSPGTPPPLVDPASLTFTTVDLSAVVNRPLADDEPNDGQGGWTDQGAGWDMRELETGRRMHEGVPYELLRPVSCLVLNAPTVRPQSQLPDVVEIAVNAPATVLYFLHSGAWMVAGEKHWTYEIGYVDGSCVEIPVIGGLHVRDWAAAGDAGVFPATRDRRTTVWPQTVETLLSPACGLYVMEWRNPKPQTQIERIRMQAEPAGGVPILLAVTLGVQ